MRDFIPSLLIPARSWKAWPVVVLMMLIWVSCSGCSLPQVKAEDRLFLPITIDFLDEYILPATDYQGTRVGGLSAIAYDRQQDLLYALSDDRGTLAPPRFYTLHLKTRAVPGSGAGVELNSIESASIKSASIKSASIKSASIKSASIESASIESASIESASIESASIESASIKIDTVEIEAVTMLSQEDGTAFPPNTLDPEGIALSPQGTLFISSEGVARDRISPSIDEFDLTSGRRLRRLPIPAHYRPSGEDGNQPEGQPGSQTAPQTMGVQNNLGFEALTLSAAGMGVGNNEPFRIFAGLEEPLLQDAAIIAAEHPQPSRILHYVVSPDQAFVLSEHVYPIDPLPFGAVNTGLVELLTLGPGGNLLSLERSYGLGGVRAKLFQTAFSNATDTATFTFLSPDAEISEASGASSGLDGIQPMRKQLVLDLYELGLSLDNLEGMTLGPRLPDGSNSLILISDNNFNEEDQVTQILLFRIKGL